MASHTESSNSTTSADKTNVASKSDPEASSPAVLPKLSAAEFRQYNSMAEHMEHFHNHFRLTWNEIYDTAAGTPTTNRKPLSARQLIETGLRFLAQLTLHHSVEETYIFPRLAERMPAFQDNDELKTHHKRIHEGMEALEAYLKACKSGERDLRMGEIKGLMDSWREVLWTHLDREVQELGAENMRRYWKVEEMKTLGF
ncbi:hypothetical protein DFH27DRAFT_590594 [Peziza echinospora]|nr:hypothetical protein DFH27DRAFT_590594 [Peziza echinospora]